MNTNKKVATFLVSLPYHELKFLAIAFLNLAQTRNIFFSSRSSSVDLGLNKLPEVNDDDDDDVYSVDSERRE